MRLVVVLVCAMLALATTPGTAAPAADQAGAARARPPAPAKPPPPKSPFTPPAFKITIATEAAYPPFNYLDRKGLPAGFEMELAQDACQRMKAECEFVAAKWDDLVPGLIDKKFDIVMSSLEVNNERRRRLGMSRRYYLSPGAFIAAKGAAVRRPAVAAAQQEDRRAEGFDACRLGSTRASAVRPRSSATPRWPRR